MFTRLKPGVRSAADLHAAYDALYMDEWLSPRTALLHWIVRLLDARPGQRVLDVACGDGQLPYAARDLGLICYGVDRSPRAVQRAGSPYVLVGDGTRLPFADGAFDYVTNIGSLEHFADMRAGVREMARVLKPHGVACVLLPNAFSLTWNLWHVWRTGDLADDGQPIQRYGTRRAWSALLTENGLEVQRTLGYERRWPRARAEWNLYLRQPKELILAALAPWMPLNLRRCFIFLCRPRPVP